MSLPAPFPYFGGNVIEPDVPAVAAWRRVQQQRAVTA